MNILTAEFINRFCDAQGKVKWIDLIDFNSGRKSAR
jgi:hypothetical protein